MISSILSRLVILICGILYPAYSSYKAVKARSAKEYVKWLMYWIVFAFFTTAETFTDVFLSWIPFYYELKILLLIWLISPVTRGSNYIYRTFIHPTLSSREHEIDEYISKTKERTYQRVIELGHRGVSAIMQTALKSGGGIVNHLKRSYSLSDVVDVADAITNGGNGGFHGHIGRGGRTTNLSQITSCSMDFGSCFNLECEDNAAMFVKSIEDITSGDSTLYAEQLNRSVCNRRDGVKRNSDGGPRITRSMASVDKNLPIIDGSEDEEDDVFNTNVIFDKTGKTGILEEEQRINHNACDEIKRKKQTKRVNFADDIVERYFVVANDDFDDCDTALSNSEHRRRGGKHKKRTAPAVPSAKPKKSLPTESTVKAILLLNPGRLTAIQCCSSENVE